MHVLTSFGTISVEEQDEKYRKNQLTVHKKHSLFVFTSPHFVDRKCFNNNDDNNININSNNIT
jgi:hypothetical protein